MQDPTHRRVLGLAFGDRIVGAAVLDEQLGLQHFELIRPPIHGSVSDRHDHVRLRLAGLCRWQRVTDVVLEEPSPGATDALAIAQTALAAIGQLGLPFRLAASKPVAPQERAIALAERFPAAAYYLPRGHEQGLVEPWLRTWNFAFAALAAACEV